MLRLLSLVLWGVGAVYCASALADDSADQRIINAGLWEGQDILSRELFGHYDIASLVVLKTEPLQSRSDPERDYGLVTITLAFSTKRNATRSPNLNPEMFEPGSAMCQGWPYLHCGVPGGYVFDGALRLLLAVDRDGSWRAVSPHWRSRRTYPLDGYLLLEGLKKEGRIRAVLQPGGAVVAAGMPWDPQSRLRLEVWSYLVFLAAGLPLVLIGCPQILGEFGLIDADTVGTLDLMFSIMVISPGLVIWAIALVFGAVSLVMGPARLRRRLLLSYGCVGLLLFLATEPSLPNRTAASLGAAGLIFLMAGPIVWLFGIGRECRRGMDESSHEGS